MTVNRETLEKLGRFLLRNDWTGRISDCRHSARSPRTDPQLGVVGGRIQFPVEPPALLVWQILHRSCLGDLNLQPPQALLCGIGLHRSLWQQ